MDEVQQEAAAVRREAYIKALKAHDWQYDYADASAVRARGRTERARLMLERAEIDADAAIWNAHAPAEFRAAAPAQYLIASLKHTHKGHEHITWWRPNRCGYTPVLDDAGRYNEDDSAKLNNGVDYIAVPVNAVLALSVPTPFYKPGRQFYDIAGPVVENTRANWTSLIEASITAGRTDRPKPEAFRGARRCLPAGVPA